MVASTDQKARMLDLVGEVIEDVREGRRDIYQVLDILQAVKDDSVFAKRLFSPQKVKELLAPTHSDIKIPITTTDFVVKNNFKKGVAGITYVSDDFQKLFGGQVLHPRNRFKLQGYDLTRNSRDWGILAKIDGREETDLAAVFHLISIQSDCQEGVLLTNGYANIFYIRDVKDELRAVFVFWRGGGWVVFALPVGARGGWARGPRVFSRNS